MNLALGVNFPSNFFPMLLAIFKYDHFALMVIWEAKRNHALFTCQMAHLLAVTLAMSIIFCRQRGSCTCFLRWSVGTASGSMSGESHQPPREVYIPPLNCIGKDVRLAQLNHLGKRAGGLMCYLWRCADCPINHLLRRASSPHRLPKLYGDVAYGVCQA